MIDIKCTGVQALIDSKSFTYAGVKEELEYVSEGLKEVGRLLSNKGKFSHNYAITILCGALDDITRLVVLGPDYVGFTDMRFSQLKRGIQHDGSWEFKGLLCKLIKRNRNLFRELQSMYHYRNMHVAHTCKPAPCDKVIEWHRLVKLLCKELGDFLEFELKKEAQ